MNWGLVFQTVIALLGVAATVYGIKVGFRGKQNDVVQARLAAELAVEQQEKDRDFEVLNESIRNLRRDLEYHIAELRKARDDRETALREKDRLQDEWVDRHRKVLERCRTLTRQLRRTLQVSTLTDDQRAAIAAMVLEAEQHIRDDHNRYDD